MDTALTDGSIFLQTVAIVIPPQKTHQFPHIKRHHIRFRNCPPHADTQHALPGYSIATQPHSDRVFNGFDRAFINSNKIPPTFDTNSSHLNRVPSNSDRASTISNVVSIHFNRVSITFDSVSIILAGSPLTHSLRRAGLRYRSPVHRLNRLLHTWHGTEMNSQGTLNRLFHGQCSKCR